MNITSKADRNVGAGLPRQYDAAKSAIAHLIGLRFVARRAHAARGRVADQTSSARRTLNLLRQSPKFNAHRIKLQEEMLTLLAEHTRAWIDGQRNIGRSLMELAPVFDAATTSQQRFEVLNINVADRRDIESGQTGLIMLVLAHGLEDSAMHRRDQFIDNPMHEAINIEMMRVMFDTPAGIAATEQVFAEERAPGGLLHKLGLHFDRAEGMRTSRAPKLALVEGGENV